MKCGLSAFVVFFLAFLSGGCVPPNPPAEPPAYPQKFEALKRSDQSPQGTLLSEKDPDRHGELKGSPLDSDGDGISDASDQCRDTPKGAQVDSRGCWVIRGVLFDTAKWDIKRESVPILTNVVTVLKANPELRIEVQGHTDNRGAAQFNKTLSENRAKAIREYLVRQGIPTWRFSIAGYGFSRPVTSNATPEGRAQNRRVELSPLQ
ncbi:MAG: OmpA family protein [Nitrospinota bacterium]